MADRFQVIVTDFIADALEPERRILGALADITALDAYSEDDLAGRIEQADAVMMYHNLALSRKTIERLTRCKLIVRCGVGIDNVDHAFAATRSIAVANVPDYGSEEVADTALAMLEDLAGNRIGRAFEVDTFNRADASPEPERTSVSFSIR